MEKEEIIKENKIKRPSGDIKESDWVKDYDGIDTFGLQFAVINNQLPFEELNTVCTTDTIGRKVFELSKRWIIPGILLSVAGLIQILENPMILLWIAPLFAIMLTLSCWCYHLHKYIRICLLQIEKLRLESILDRRHLLYKESHD